MNKAQREVAEYLLDKEERIIRQLERQYQLALEDVEMDIRIMLMDEQTPSRIHRVEYQRRLKKQIETTLETLHRNEYKTINAFLQDSYKDSFVGTMYDLHSQGVPVIIPIDQNAAVKAIQLDTQLSDRKIHPNANGEHVTLYESLGVDVDNLKETIRLEITRGLATNMQPEVIARNIANLTKAPLSRAKTIARTEAHRIQEASAQDARERAISRGARVVKQWDATMDGATREAHRRLDGQIVEVHEPFVYGTLTAMYPGDFGDPAQDCNCRCKATQRARWMLDEEELETLKQRAEFFGLAEDKAKKQQFAEFEKKYLYAADHPAEYLRGTLPKDFEDRRKVGEPIKQADLQKAIETARLKGVQIGTEDNPTGGFETYCGDVTVLNDVIDQVAKQLDSDLFQNSRGKKVILAYDNVTGYMNDNQVIDIGAFAMTKGRTITLNKFMFDDSSFLATEYAGAVKAGLFAKGTDHTCIIAHEVGHIISKYTRGLYRRTMAVIEDAAAKKGVPTTTYIIQNVSGYAARKNQDWEYSELIPELNSMLNSGKKYGIIELLRKEGVI